MKPGVLPIQRHVSPLLATAIVAVPVIFTWLLLRRGYAPSTRRAGFLFMAVSVLPRPIAALLEG